MITEEQAKQTLYCPMKFAGDWEDGRCMGSDCAAWRWDDDCRSVHVARGGPDERPASVPPDWVYVPASGSVEERYFVHAHWAEPEGPYLARRTGFCGLGGKP